MDDLISRQDAIDKITEYGSGNVTCMSVGELKRRIEQLPSAQPERKKGKWVIYDGDWLKTMFKCSECGAMIDINEKDRNFFCYHCGADMRGEQK